MARLSDLAKSHPKWDVVALTGDCSGVLPGDWNDWPQSLKLSVSGNHDSSATFAHLNSWVHKTPWFLRHDELVFLGIDTSDLSHPFAKLEDQLDAFWDEDIKSVSVFVLLTHQWPLDHELDQAGQLLAKFIGKSQLLVLDGHNHPRGTKWDMNASLGPIPCFRSTVISCNAPKGTGHLITWNGKRLDCEAVRGEHEKRRPVVMSAASIKFSTEPPRGKKSQ